MLCHARWHHAPHAGQRALLPSLAGSAGQRQEAQHHAKAQLKARAEQAVWIRGQRVRSHRAQRAQPARAATRQACQRCKPRAQASAQHAHLWFCDQQKERADGHCRHSASCDAGAYRPRHRSGSTHQHRHVEAADGQDVAHACQPELRCRQRERRVAHASGHGLHQRAPSGWRPHWKRSGQERVCTQAHALEERGPFARGHHQASPRHSQRAITRRSARARVQLLGRRAIPPGHAHRGAARRERPQLLHAHHQRGRSGAKGAVWALERCGLQLKHLAGSAISVHRKHVCARGGLPWRASHHAPHAGHAFCCGPELCSVVLHADGQPSKQRCASQAGPPPSVCRAQARQHAERCRARHSHPHHRAGRRRRWMLHQASSSNAARQRRSHHQRCRQGAASVASAAGAAAAVNPASAVNAASLRSVFDWASARGASRCIHPRTVRMRFGTPRMVRGSSVRCSAV